MGNGCRYPHQQSFYKQNTFLPLLCRVSTRDVRLRNRKDGSANSMPHDPSSPKVSCIGQVKKSSQFSAPFRLAGVGTTTASSTGDIIKYTKLKRLFSGKSVPTTPFPSSRFNDDLNIGELDPPLPVTGKAARPTDANLWKRRSGGRLALSRLEIHAPAPATNNYHPAATL